MYRVLIVDNEPLVVDGIYSLLQEADHLELDLMTACSAQVALDILNQYKIDVIFADIQMPGMNGLELQNRVQKRWSRCKVILLTGFSDFNYVQSAIRNQGFDYILKSEGDERIVKALEDAIHALEAVDSSEEIWLQARQQLYQAKPLLQREFIINLLDGERFAPDKLSTRLSELGIMLSPEDEVLLVLTRVDEWPDHFTGSDRMLISYAIQNITQEHLSLARMVSVPYDRNRTVWLLQLAEETNGIGGLQPYVQSNLDAIQSTCRTLLKITVSFVIMTNSCPWPQLPMTFLALRQMMERGLGLGTEIILSGADTEMDQNPLSEGGRWLAQLEHLLDRGELEPFGAICDAMLQASSIRYSRYAEVYLNIAMLLLTKYNRYELDQQVDPSITIEGLLNMEQHFTWYFAAQYLKKMAASIIDQRNQEQKEKSNDIIIKIYQYIQDHLEEDLSLNKLATYVYLNPSYLSRLFKLVTDVSLSEYIAEQRLGKAKYLLNTTDMKVQEVAKSVGLATGYFIRFFKKVTHATPQEYRETFHNK